MATHEQFTADFSAVELSVGGSSIQLSSTIALPIELNVAASAERAVVILSFRLNPRALRLSVDIYFWLP